MVKEAQSQKEDAVARALAQAHKSFESEVLVLRNALHKLKMQVRIRVCIRVCMWVCANTCILEFWC
jgi:hypothetical protein